MDKIRKSVIGVLIGIYRTDLCDNSHNLFSRVNFCKQICDIKTLRLIEQGYCIKHDDIYVDLIKKFNLQYAYFPEIDKKLVNHITSLTKAIDYYDLAAIMKYATKCIKDVSEAKEVIYYAELYKLFQGIYHYYKYDKEIDKSEMERFIKVYKLYPAQVQPLFKRMIYARAVMETMDDFTTTCKILLTLDLLKESNPTMKSLMMYYFYINKQYVTLNRFILCLEEAFIETENYCRLLDVYSFAFSLYSEIESPIREEYAKKVDDVISAHSIPSIKINEVFSNFACAYYNEQNYKKAMEYFNEILKHPDEIFLPHGVYAADCQRHLHLPIYLPKIKIKVWKKYSQGLQHMYQYFMEYDALSLPAKENYILKKIAPFLTDTTLTAIFHTELKGIVKETRHYKKLIVFEDIVEENNT